MQRIANPYYVFKRRVGSTPTLSAIFLILFTSSSFAYESHVKFLQQYVPIEWNGYWCSQKQSYNTVYLPVANKIEVCENNIVEKFGKANLKDKIISGLLHEAIHLAQDCKAGLQNHKMDILSKKNVEFIPTSVKRIYNPVDYEIETEAKLFEKDNVALDFVLQYCKRV